MVKAQQLLALKLILIFQLWHISTFLEINPDEFLYANKVISLSLPMTSISILH